MSIEDEIQQITSNDLKERHSFFQLQYFLIGKEPTIQSKLWRCIRELQTRKETIAAIKLEIDNTNDNLELIDIDIQELAASEGRREKIKTRKKERKKTEFIGQLQNLENRLKNVLEECDYLVRTFRTIEKMEPLKSFDDLAAQKDYWNNKLGQEFNLRMLLGMPMDLELFKTILALNSDSPVKKDAIQLINTMQEKIDNNAKQKEYKQLLESTQNEKSSEEKLIMVIENGI